MASTNTGVRRDDAGEDGEDERRPPLKITLKFNHTPSSNAPVKPNPPTKKRGRPPKDPQSSSQSSKKQKTTGVVACRTSDRLDQSALRRALTTSYLPENAIVVKKLEDSMQSYIGQRQLAKKGTFLDTSGQNMSLHKLAQQMGFTSKVELHEARIHNYVDLTYLVLKEYLLVKKNMGQEQNQPSMNMIHENLVLWPTHTYWAIPNNQKGNWSELDHWSAFVWHIALHLIRVADDDDGLFATRPPLVREQAATKFLNSPQLIVRATLFAMSHALPTLQEKWERLAANLSGVYATRRLEPILTATSSSENQFLSRLYGRAEVRVDKVPECLAIYRDNSNDSLATTIRSSSRTTGDTARIGYLDPEVEFEQVRKLICKAFNLCELNRDLSQNDLQLVVHPAIDDENEFHSCLQWDEVQATLESLDTQARIARAPHYPYHFEFTPQVVTGGQDPSEPDRYSSLMDRYERLEDQRRDFDTVDEAHEEQQEGHESAPRDAKKAKSLSIADWARIKKKLFLDTLTEDEDYQRANKVIMGDPKLRAMMQERQRTILKHVSKGQEMVPPDAQRKTEGDRSETVLITGNQCIDWQILQDLPPDASPEDRLAFKAFHENKQATFNELLKETTSEANIGDIDLVTAEHALRIQDGNLGPSVDHKFPESVNQVKLYPHQIIGAADLYKRGTQTEYPRALVSDHMGLGKTLMIVAAIAATIIDALEHVKYTKPTLIAAPLAILREWASTLQRYGLEVVSIWTDYNPSTGFPVKQYGAWQTARAPNNTRRFADADFECLFTKIVPGSPHDKPEYMDRMDEQTTRLVVLTTPETLRARAMITMSREDWRISHGLAVAEPKDVPEKMYDVDELWRDRFHRLVLDEAQCIKGGPRVGLYWLFKRFKCPAKFLSTGSMMLNRVEDVAAFFGVIWTEEQELKRLHLRLSDEDEADLNSRLFTGHADPTSRYADMSNDEFENTFCFLRYSRRQILKMIDSFKGEDPAKEWASVAAVYKPFVIRRKFGSEYYVDAKASPPTMDVVGKEVPGYTVSTLTLRMTEKEQERYATIHNVLIKHLYKGKDALRPVDPNFVNEAANTLMDNGVARVLTMAAGSGREFDINIGCGGHTSSVDMEDWRLRRRYHGLKFLARCAEECPTVSKCPLRTSMDREVENLDFWDWWCEGGPHLRALCYLILKVVVEQGERIVVFAEWPFTQVFLETFFRELGFLTASISKDMDFTERSAVVDDFNSTKVDGAAFTQILFLTYAVSGVAISAHKDCHTAVIYESGSSIDVEDKAMCRLRRSTSRIFQTIFRLVTADTYDQMVDARIIEKCFSNLRAQGGRKFRELIRDANMCNIDKNEQLHEEAVKLAKRSLGLNLKDQPVKFGKLADDHKFPLIEQNPEAGVILLQSGGMTVRIRY